MRLIDADALLLNTVAVTNSKGQVTWSAVSTIDILTSPTVDAVEVVRCKDCKYYKPNPYDEDGENYCQYWVDWIPTYSDDFCCYGERKK